MIAHSFPRPRSLYLSLFVLTALIWSACAASAQTAQMAQIEIAKDLELIRTAEQQHRPNAEQGALWVQLATRYHSEANFLKAEDAYNQALRLLKDTPSAGAEYANALDDLVALYLNYGHIEEAESVRKRAVSAREKLATPSDIGLSQVHLADIAYARHQYKKAERFALRGLSEMDQSSDPPRVGKLSALIIVAYSRCLQGHPAEGLTSAQQALAWASARFAPQSGAMGFALQTLGFAEWKNGAPQQGEASMQRGIQILRAQLVPGDPRLAGVLLQYRDYLITASRPAEAQEIHEEVLRMNGQAGPVCAACTVSVYSLSKTLR